ncbi:putative kinetoplastid kinetochore protein 2 [Trypanosoma cruzi]|uniref:Serine/threonine-protein kinase PLK n=1 Tax=Trypanosoma cruzi TaxID=5693 RepID=A0A2V2V684_TRYCR|nr:putative kinetoplastid kinetochore protein 2 [Trypanosoma cruzi]
MSLIEKKQDNSGGSSNSNSSSSGGDVKARKDNDGKAEEGGEEKDGRLRTPRSYAMLSIPRELSHTPAIAGLSPTVRTPFIQRCHLHHGDYTGTDNKDEHYRQPLEHMTIIFEEDSLQLTTTSLLGKGGFGRVYAARSNGGELYALKVSAKKLTEGDWARLLKEVELMNHFSRHPNVVKFIAAGRDEETAYVVMECCASRSLHDVIANHGLDVPEILWVGWALVDTIAFMHSKGCIHRDLKPQNLLFDFDGNLKITDFGLSSRIAEAQPRKTVAGTAMYMAPEIAEAVYKRMSHSTHQPALQYGQEVDTWSIGVVIYVMLTRMNPYMEAMEKRGTREMDKTQKTLSLFNAVADAAWEWPTGWSGDPELCDLVNRALHRDTKKRATLQEVLQHPVWNRRPLSCPLSLLYKLNLLERPSSSSVSRHGSTRRSLTRLADNIPIPTGKRTADDVLAEGMRRVVLTEQRARANLVLEHHETLRVMLELLKLSRAEADVRRSICEDEQRYRTVIQNQRVTQRSRRRRSEALVSSFSAATVATEVGPVTRSSRSHRQSSVVLVAPAASTKEEFGRIVRASPDKYAMVYPGRDTATRWSLRPVISLPRELNREIEEFRCLNHHIMTKLTAMPHGYNGFDCNVCDREILKISLETPAFRCYKCDYDLCMRCAYQGRLKDVNFVCVSCAKKFTSSAKLQAHSLQCRGPSWSPSPRRSSRMNTMLWEEAEPRRGSLLEVRLPDDPKPRASGRPSGRSSTGRASSGGRISIGDSHVASPEDVGTMVVQHRDASFPEMPFTRQTGSGGGRRSTPARVHGCEDVNSSFSFELPPEIRLSRLKKGERIQPRTSAEMQEVMDVDSPPLKKERKEARGGGQEKATPPYKVNESGNIVGIAAQHRAAREASLQQQQKQQGQGVIVIRADAAAKPPEMSRQPQVPRSVSSSRSAGAVSSAATNVAPKPIEPHLAKVTRTAISTPTPTNTTAPAAPMPNMPKKGRQPSAGGMVTLHGGPPLPRRGPGMPQNTPYLVPQAVPPPNFPVPRQPSHPLVQSGVEARQVVGGHRVSGGNNAFLALPREEQNRQRFVDDFLSGGWVRFYSFTNEETVVMYYCAQPGRYGAMFPTEAGVGTAVVDVHSRLVLYVPCMNNESTNRSQPHPHVQTFYDEDVRLLSVSEAQRHLGGVLESIMGFVNEVARLRAEGLTPAAVHAAYIHQRDKSSVPKDTKFVYVRKVFPDPSGSFTLFRLSNLRSQVVCNTLMDIRWQSDRRHNVGQKYYVLADGTAEPFVVDHTGILTQVETVLSNNFRR